MLFDSHHLLVALGPGPPRCAGPADPSPPSPPSCRRRPTHHCCSPWSIARTQEGCSFFQTMCFDHHRLHVALAAPLAGSTTLCQSLSPSPPSQPCYRHRPAHHWCSPRSFVRTRALNAAGLLQPGPRALTTPLQLPEHWNWAFTATQLLLSGPGHWNLAATWLSVPQRLRPPLPHPITERPQTRLVLATV